MSRRRKQLAPSTRDRWLISYADFITLLFAFFVVLYATSKTDNKRVVQISAAIHGGFQDLGVFSGGAGESIVRAEVAPASLVQTPPDRPELAEVASGKEAIGALEGVDVDRLRKQLEEVLGDEIKRHEIEMRVTPEGLVVSLREIGFFDSGTAVLLQEGQAPLGRIARILNAKGFQIRVEGHTDNVPIHTSRFKSNWELSTARATEVVALLVERYGFDPLQVSAAGYSQYRPIANNEIDEGRKTNRRVDLVVVAKSAPTSKDASGTAAVRTQRGN
jgi:chemotaxis protein MotB